MAHLTPSFATRIPYANDSNKLIKNNAYYKMRFFYSVHFWKILNFALLTMFVFPQNNNATYIYSLLKPIEYIKV